MNKWLACALVAVTSGCVDIKTDANETSAEPTVEFDPGRSVVPFPNNLLIDQASGRVNLPPGCNESAASKATREGVLNKLDGFGTFETAMSVTLTAAVDPVSLEGNVLLFDSSDPAGNTIPVVIFPGTSIRYANQTKDKDTGALTCDSPNPIDSITIVPRAPLKQKTNYIVALKRGIKDAAGKEFVPSFTWSLVRQPENPVTVDDKGVIISDRTPLDPSSTSGRDSLLGINLLWNAHAPVLQFLGAKGVMRDEVLLGWSFKTQTVTDALDPTVAGTPASMLNDTPVTGPGPTAPVPLSVSDALRISMARTAPTPEFPYAICNTGAGGAPAEPNTPTGDAQCFLKLAFGFASSSNPRVTTCTDAATCGPLYAVGSGTCALFSCSSVGNIFLGSIKSPQFQAAIPNTVTPNKPIPGPWSDPVKPTKVADEDIPTFIFVPTGAPPAGGWPTALFQHGLGQSSQNIIAIGGHLARNGFATVAIDAVAHGQRRVRISNEGNCATNPDASCFAGFLSANLGSTRDNIRQTVVDHLQVIASLKKCTGVNSCGTFVADAAHIVYIGQSLGGILGGVTHAVSPDIKASVLNVAGIGWADIFENTQTLAIRCTLVDALIDAGTLTGAKRDTMGTPTEADDTGLCVGQEWKTQPGYRQFSAIARWVLDPADPANFASRLVQSMGTKKFLLQEVVGDTVVPNLATENMAALTGRTALTAGPNTSLTAPTPTPGITSPMPASKFVKYVNQPANAGTGFPGNTFTHGSLLQPAPSANGAGSCSGAMPLFCDGVLGTAQMVADAIAYLVVNR